MRILAVTSVGGACGIWNYAEQMIAATQAADPSLAFSPQAEALDPAWLQGQTDVHGLAVDAVWLNYHRGLHSRWTPEAVARLRSDHGRKIPVVITFHDSVGERPPDALTQALHDLADAFVVHEPCEGLPKQILIRQGVPAPPWMHIYELDVLTPWKQYPNQPILGTVGFNFPWKNFDRLAEVTAEAGWAYLVLSNNATEQDEKRWKTANPSTKVLGSFRPTDHLVSALAYADATCFPYECANSGTSGAIRLGLAARKPVIAWTTRQFRDLWESTKALPPTIRWCASFDALPVVLQDIPISRVDPRIAYLAHRDSWTHQGQKYAEIFRSLA